MGVAELGCESETRFAKLNTCARHNAMEGDVASAIVVLSMM